MPPSLAIVVFSHLRWGFVYQRPQHLLSRLASHARVIFIEEPVHDARSKPRIDVEQVAENTLVCTPYTPLDSCGFSDDQNAVVAPLLPDLLKSLGVDRHIAWFYSPMALSLAEQLTPECVVYDCMDELAAFANAPPQLLERETALLAVADLVFTGGPSLFQSKRNRHPRVYCFPSSVDAGHFGKAIDRLSETPRQQSLPSPRLGYFGVIDERFDADLLDYLARSRPAWQFVMVGPVVKIDAASLPQHANIHYFGQQKYDDLPGYLAGWDVCLLPFARNDATRFISPTKTLEYMAAERMIVSTPITDVAEPYGEIVFLGATQESFLNNCELALTASKEERERRIGQMRDVLANTSWDKTVDAMWGLVTDAVDTSKTSPLRATEQGPAARQTVRRPDPSAGAAPASPPIRAQHGQKPLKPTGSSTPLKGAPTLIIGAGPTGLSASYHLGEDSLLIEANDDIGGWCRSITEGGFTFDYAGHIMFSNDEYVHEMYETLLGDNVHWQDREAWIYSKEVYTRYPFQGALYGLPAEVIKECLLGAIEARYGVTAKESPSCNRELHHHGPSISPLAKTSAGSPLAKTSAGRTIGVEGPSRTPRDLPPVEDCCGDGVMESTVRLVAPSSNGHGRNGAADHAHSVAAGTSSQTKGENFEQFIYRVWGRGIAAHFAIPYNRKLWAVPLTEMETSWLGGRVPMPDLGEMIDGALQPSPKPMGPNARFGYPLRGGFQALMDGFRPFIENRLRLNSRVAKVSPRRKSVTLTSGEEMTYESLISTMPLPALIKSIGDEAPREVVRAAAKLRNVSVRCVHLGIGRERLTEKHWIYYPEETVFHRIFVQGNASPHCNPPGGFGLTCEITYSPHKPLPCDGDELIQRCIDDCIKVGIVREGDPIWAATQCDLPYAYVVYDHDRAANVAVIRNWLESQGIHLAGRYSEWEYYNSDHAFLAGRRIAERARQDLGAAKATANG